MCVCVHVHVRVCMCAWMCACVYVCVDVCMCVCVCACVHVHTCTHACVCERTQVIFFRGEVINGGFGLLLDGSEVSYSTILYILSALCSLPSLGCFRQS